MNQVIDEVNCYEQPGVTIPGIFCESNSAKSNVRRLFLLS